MRVKFVSGPHAGEARHCERSAIIDLLIDAGVLEHAALVDPLKPVEPRREKWSVALTRFGEPAIFHVTKAGEHLPYQGTPEGAVAAYARSHATVPAEILEQYKAAYRRANISAARHDGETR